MISDHPSNLYLWHVWALLYSFLLFFKDVHHQCTTQFFPIITFLVWWEKISTCMQDFSRQICIRSGIHDIHIFLITRLWYILQPIVILGIIEVMILVDVGMYLHSILYTTYTEYKKALIIILIWYVHSK